MQKKDKDIKTSLLGSEDTAIQLAQLEGGDDNEEVANTNILSPNKDDDLAVKVVKHELKKNISELDVVDAQKLQEFI